MWRSQYSRLGLNILLGGGYLFFNEGLKDHLRDQTQSRKQLTEVTNKLERLEERFIEGELTKELFEKYQSKFKEERVLLEKKLADQPFNSLILKRSLIKEWQSQKISVPHGFPGTLMINRSYKALCFLKEYDTTKEKTKFESKE
jgi:hypothetical protein